MLLCLASPLLAQPPPEQRLELGPQQLSIRARTLFLDSRRRMLTAEGDVTVRHRDLTLTAPRASADLGAKSLRVEGPLRLTRPGGLWLRADWLEAGLDDQRYRSGPFTAQVPPKEVGGAMTQPLNVRGAESTSEGSRYFSGRRIVATTCPLDSGRYYDITAKAIAVRPDRDILFRSAKMHLFGIPILAVSKLVVPYQRTRKVDWLPEWGRNDVYGWYGRYRYLYDLAPRQGGNLMAMMTERRGAFVGFDHDFGCGRQPWSAMGRASLTYGTRDGDLSVRGEWNQGLGQGGNLRANGDYSRNSGFSSLAQQSNLTSQYSQRFAWGTTTLGLSRSGSSSSTYATQFDRVQLGQQVTLGKVFGADLGLDFTGRSQTSARADEQLQTRARFAGQSAVFDWEVIDQRRFDLGAAKTQTGYGITEIVPQATLRTDARRLRLGLPDALDVRLESSLGEYRETTVAFGGASAGVSTVLRANMDLKAALTRWYLGRRAFVTADARYSQSFFDHPGPAAKYVVSFGPLLQVQPLPHQRLDLRYRWQEVSGYSPLARFDYAATINDLDVTWNLFVPDRVRLRQGKLAVTANTGFDFLTGLWRDVRLDLRARPIDELGVIVGTTYALEGRGYGAAGLRPVRAQFVYDGGKRYRHEVGLTYDPQRGRFGTIDSLARLMPLRRLTLQDALAWDGYNGKVTYHDVQATYDLGCVALVGYFRQQTGDYGLNLNITAFPQLGSLFGTGRFGQMFSTSQGIAF